MNKIVVLMSTYNGSKYINQQIESLIRQKDEEISIFVRDDGSTDDTLEILDRYSKKTNLTWYQGENLGPALSFMDLIKKAPQADYYAFCDQDDVWDENKLKVAVESMKNFDQDSPALYFSNKRLVDEDLKFIENTKQIPKITFGSALIINPVTGCTLVINRKLLEIMRLYDNRNLYMHDAWIYRVCMALNGNVYFDEEAHISYRQHANNVIGGKSNFFQKYKRRINNVVFNRKRIRENMALELLNGYSEKIPPQNLELINKVTNYRKNVKNRLILLFDRRFRTYSWEHNISFFFAVTFNAF